ncbi:hypothetical protein F5X96DRAFT_693241 [Biscogniauxia mediterranea]|nr:hypothetical protein F5X96DRAFT_693241 [Biscogniauxia mediterranea]
MATVTVEPAPLPSSSSSLRSSDHRVNGSNDTDTGKKKKKRERHDVSTFINYYKDPGDGSPPMPIRISDTTVKNERPTVAHPTLVRDITGEEHRYTLDAHGFQLCRLRRRCRCGEEEEQEEEEEEEEEVFRDPERVREVYYPVCEELLKEVTGASRVLVFDHKTRSGPSHWHRLGENNRAARGPLMRAHVDQSYDGAEIVLRRHLPHDEAEELLIARRRWMIVNVWRPLKTVFKDPLAAADATSVPDADLVPAQILYRDGSRDETWTILPPSSSSPSSSSGTRRTAADDDGKVSAQEEKGKEKTETRRGHRWYFKYAQTPAEALLIKCFDSSTTTARRAPHSAFVDPAHEDGEEEARVSVEARALVYFD